MKTAICSLILAFTAVVNPLSADFIQVQIDHLVNQNLRDYVDGGSYPVAPETLTVGGVDFGLVALELTPNSLGIFGPDSGSTTTIAVNNVFGVTTAYTLINSGFGQIDVTNGQVEFYGTNGAFATFDLLQGFNIRDHRQGNYNNVVTDPTIVTANFGNARLDRQTFVLPSVFESEFLTEIRLVMNNNTGIQGNPFVAGITIQAVPEPSSVLFLFAFSGLAAVRRRRCKTTFPLWDLNA